MKFSSINVVILCGAMLLVVQASARNLEEFQNFHLRGAFAPTKAESPIVNEEKNFMYGGGIGGAVGVGGIFGMPGVGSGGGGGSGVTLPPPLLGGGGAFGGIGGGMGFPGGLGGGVPSTP